MATFTLTGFDSLETRLRDLTRDIRQNATDAIREEAEEIVRIAKEELVPISAEPEAGRLRDSIRVEESGTGVKQGRIEGGQFTEGADVSISIVAGGEGIEYAVAVEMNPSEYDPPTWQGKQIQWTKPGTGPGFISRPLQDRSKGLASRVAGKVFK